MSVTSWVMLSVTPGITVKVVVFNDEAYIASLKVAVMTAREHTPVAPLRGDREITVGGGLHPLEAVLKQNGRSSAGERSYESNAPVFRSDLYIWLIAREKYEIQAKIVIVN